MKNLEWTAEELMKNELLLEEEKQAQRVAEILNEGHGGEILITTGDARGLEEPVSKAYADYQMSDHILHTHQGYGDWEQYYSEEQLQCMRNGSSIRLAESFEMLGISLVADPVYPSARIQICEGDHYIADNDYMEFFKDDVNRFDDAMKVIE